MWSAEICTADSGEVEVSIERAWRDSVPDLRSVVPAPTRARVASGLMSVVCASVRGSRGEGIACVLWCRQPVAEIRFLSVGGRRLGYEVSGVGPLWLSPAWWVSHLELDRGDRAFARFWGAVGGGFSMVRYDRLGVGVSDRELWDEDLAVDGEVEVIGALLDELGVERVGLLGGSSGGCAAIALAGSF
jgi:hypothetical protein